MKTTFLILKTLTGIAALPAIYFTSRFWIGSREGWDAALKNGFWEFVFSRFAVTVFAGGIFFLISLLLNRIFKKEAPYKSRWIFMELVFLIIASIIFVTMAIKR